MSFNPINLSISSEKTPFVLTQQGSSNITLPAGESLTGSINLVGPSAMRGASGFVAGQYAENEIVLASIAPYSFDISNQNSKAVSITSATNETIFTIKRTSNGVTDIIGTVLFATGSAVGAIVVTDGTINRDDLVTVHAPATTDPTLADIAFLLVE